MRQMPKELALHISSKVKDLSFQETADICDDYFDQNGKILDSNILSSINHVSSAKQQQPQQQQPRQPNFTTPFDAGDTEPEINAVCFKDGQRRNFEVSNRSSSRGRSSNSNNYSNFRSQSRSNNSFRPGASGDSSSNVGSNPPKKKVCKFHTKWGEHAENCEGSWCILKDKMAPKGQASR